MVMAPDCWVWVEQIRLYISGALGINCIGVNHNCNALNTKEIAFLKMSFVSISQSFIYIPIFIYMSLSIFLPERCDFDLYSAYEEIY